MTDDTITQEQVDTSNTEAAGHILPSLYSVLPHTFLHPAKVDISGLDPNDLSAHACTMRGAALLDREVPDWTDKVDPHSLVMSDACHCVCGQVFADKVSEGGSPTNESGSGYWWAISQYETAPRTWADAMTSDTRDWISWAQYHGFDQHMNTSWHGLKSEWIDRHTERVSQ